MKPRPVALAYVSRLLFLQAMLSTLTAAFYSQLSPCPDLCSNVGSYPANWTVVQYVDQLKKCDRPMQFDLSLTKDLNNTHVPTLIRACVATDEAPSPPSANSGCGDSTTVSFPLQIGRSGEAAGINSVSSIDSLLERPRSQVLSQEHCGTRVLFGASPSASTVIGLYIGSGLDAPQCYQSLVDHATSEITQDGSAKTFLAQACPGTGRAETVGLVVVAGDSCCNIWGQCGITPSFCTVYESETGAPGTSPPGTASCISNCGTDFANNDFYPDEFIKIGYWESWAATRGCLRMSASRIPPGYTHIHYSFGGITNDYRVDASDFQAQFDEFKATTGFKKILSFGGWSFSTEADTGPIFREGVTLANRQTFAQNCVAFMQEHDLDGLDFDWEYPGAPDIPGIPPGSPNDGANYLEFLQMVRAIMPPGKSLSIAAPASYCVNVTETKYALAMVTKAGVPSHKVIVGVSSYGRSFGMTDPNCSGPMCTYTGPESGAFAGKCTQTKGYLADAEIEDLIVKGALAYHDDLFSDSDIAIYHGTWSTGPSIWRLISTDP
ncbi:hypothetical protein VTK26DRAFT_6028 [Humicola hyalothermophila]